MLLLLPSLQEVQRVSWYLLPGTLVTLCSLEQFWCCWHGLVLELEEEKKPGEQGLHWVFSKGVPVMGGKGTISLG